VIVNVAAAGLSKNIFMVAFNMHASHHQQYTSKES
jgi:hypothetical protein